MCSGKAQCVLWWLAMRMHWFLSPMMNWPRPLASVRPLPCVWAIMDEFVLLQRRWGSPATLCTQITISGFQVITCCDGVHWCSCFMSVHSTSHQALLTAVLSTTLSFHTYRNCYVGCLFHHFCLSVILSHFHRVGCLAALFNCIKSMKGSFELLMCDMLRLYLLYVVSSLALECKFHR